MLITYQSIGTGTGTRILVPLRTNERNKIDNGINVTSGARYRYGYTCWLGYR